MAYQLSVDRGTAPTPRAVSQLHNAASAAFTGIPLLPPHAWGRPGLSRSFLDSVWSSHTRDASYDGGLAFGCHCKRKEAADENAAKPHPSAAGTDRDHRDNARGSRPS